MAKTYRKFKKKREPEIIRTEQEEKDEASIVRKYGQSPKKERTPEEKSEYLRLLLYLIGWVVFLAGIYMACIQIGFEYIMIIYEILGIGLFLVWLVFNGGFKKVDLNKYEKPDNMGYDEFSQFIDKLKKRQKKAKYFLILFIPFPLIMMIDYIVIVWGDKLAK